MTNTALRQSNASSGEFAAALGWTDSALRNRRVDLGATELDVSRAYIAGEGALVIAKVLRRNGLDPVDAAALYSYHTASEWGILADDELGITIFNSRWSDDEDWYRLPTITWSAFRRRPELVEALAPEALKSGVLTRFAEKIKKPTGVIVPVDDALVDRLDRWRAEALKFTTRADKVDGLLQQVYAQLFVLRTVEDRKLDLGVPAIDSAFNKRTGELSEAKWVALIKTARTRIGGELFAEDFAKAVPRHVLAGVIRDLYHPRGIPSRDARYDFSWIDSDVLGTAYEKYLSTVLQPGGLVLQQDLFLTEAREVERVSVRKKKGVYYTPKYITNYLATRAVDGHFTNNGNADAPYVIDFACGSGAFLVAAIDRILFHLKSRDPNRLWARELVEGRHVVGVDIDVNAVSLARLRLWQRLLEEPGALPLPSLSHIVREGDGLNRETWGNLDRSYDIVLGNPPFLATAKVESREWLEARFVSAKGRFDFSSLFVEQALGILGSGGRLGMVVPNRFFRNTSGATLRDLLTAQAELECIVDFGVTRPFEADAYVACIVARKKSLGERSARTVKVIEVNTVEVDFLAGLLLDGAADGKVFRSFDARHPSGSGPWMLISEDDQQSRVSIEDASVRLDSIAAIAQGIRTGANEFFVFELVSDDGSRLCEVINGLGEKAVIERELLKPVIQGSEVQRFSRVTGVRRLLYPHRNRAALSEAELSISFPNAWDYFVTNRAVLAGRASLQKSGGKFYELVWPRDEAWLSRPKLLIRDLAPRTSFAMDDVGNVFIVGGTAVVPHDPEVIPALMAYLNSRFVDNYVRQSTSGFQGGYQKYEPKQLQGIPVLERFLLDAGFQENLANLSWQCVAQGVGSESATAAELEIDRLVDEAASAAGAV